MPNPSIDPPGIEFTRVSPKLIRVRHLSALIGGLIFLVIFSIPLLLVLTGVVTWLAPWIAWALPIFIIVVTVWQLILIARQVRAIGYAERDDDLLLRRGIFFQELVVVPYGRMQYVDVDAGPVQRAFGLATITLHTAASATNATLPGLPAEEADRLREVLTERGEARLAGL